MKTIDVAGVLQEADDVGSRPCTRSQVLVEYFIIPYTFISIRISHLCQGYDHHLVTENHRWKENVGWLISLKVWIGKQGVGNIFFHFFACF